MADFLVTGCSIPLRADCENSRAPRHNILHFCARELGAISAAYAATRLEGSNERESMLGWLIFSSQDARFHCERTVKTALFRTVRGRGDSCPCESNRFMALPPISYPVSIGLLSICTRKSVGAHLEQLTARFSANLACLATVRASLSWFGMSFPLPKYISSGVCPLNAECGMTRLCWST
jgi:hypothetical protein